MRIWILSDLHVDVCPYELADTPEGTDVLIIAGDIGGRLSTRVMPWLAEHAVPRGLPVVYVPGNHDFYGANTSNELDKARAVCPLGVHLLAEGEHVLIKGVRFIGATLWTDFELVHPGESRISEREALRLMNDHRKIRVGLNYRRWLPRDAAATHRLQKGRMEEILATPHEGPTVVVTHHAPTWRSITEERDLLEDLDAAYASDLEDLTIRYRPALWVHGHIHHRLDCQVGATRMVSNPRGYVLSNSSGDLEVEVPQHDPKLTLAIVP